MSEWDFSRLEAEAADPAQLPSAPPRPEPPLLRGAASGVDELQWERRWQEMPDPDAYSRVTDAERYRPLHAFALALADDLEAEFDVDRFEGLELASSRGVTPVRAVRLVPRATDAAALTLTLTDFPGVMLRFGDHTELPIPVCGCDACDELIQNLVDEVRDLVDALVTGGFTADTSGGYSYRTPRGSRSGGISAAGPIDGIRFAAWPAR